jgi:hypothetical protein
MTVALLVAGTVSAQRRQVTRDQMMQEFQVSALPRVVQFTQSGQIQEIGESVSIATIAPNSAIYARIGAAAQPTDPPFGNLEPTNRYLHLPIGIATMDADTTETLYVEAIVEIERGGLHYLNGKFQGRIGVVLVDRANVAASRPIRPAVHLSVTADPASTSPTDFAIDHTNLPFSRIDLATRHDVPSITVNVRTQMDPESLGIQVPAFRPALIVDATPRSIMGFGLAETVLTVSLNQNIDQPVEVRLSSATGRPSPPSLTLPETGSGTAVLRSEGVGSATVEASATMFESGSATVEFRFPFSFLIATLLGGSLGGLASILLTAKDKRSVTWQKRLIGGVCVGILAAVAITVGVNVTGFAFDTDHGEALFFVVSGLASLAGLTTFEKSTAK